MSRRGVRDMYPYEGVLGRRDLSSGESAAGTQEGQVGRGAD